MLKRNNNKKKIKNKFFSNEIIECIPKSDRLHMWCSDYLRHRKLPVHEPDLQKNYL